MTSPRTTALLRGGRLRKTSRGLLTFAPALATTASALALAALLSLAPPPSARAQTAGCTEDMTTAGTFTCSGTATSTVTITGEDGETLMITDPAAFSINTSSGNALVVTGTAMGGGITIDLDGAITASGTGGAVSVDHDGTGAVSVTTDAAIRGVTSGISADTSHASATTMTITASAAINTGLDGIYAKHSGTGDLNITADAITATGDAGATTGKRAFYAGLTGGNAANIDATVGAIDAQAHQFGIFSKIGGTASTGDLEITATGNVTATNTPIYASNEGNGDMTVSIAGTINATYSSGMQDAILMKRSGSTGATRLIMNTGASINAGDRVRARHNAGSTEADDTDAILELAAAAADTPSTFTLSTLSDFSGFNTLEKTGAGTWIVTGNQPTDKLFKTADVTAGTLRLNTATLRFTSGAFDELSPATGSTLEVTGINNTIAGGLNASRGNVSLAMNGDATPTDDRLTVTNFVSGGTLTLNVAFETGTDAADLLSITGTISTGGRGENPTTIVNLIATGDHANLDSGGLRLIAAPMNQITTAFSAGSVTFANGIQRSFTIARNSTDGNWELTAVGAILAGCEEQSTAATFSCSGTTTATQLLTASAGEALVVTDESDFAITVASGDALRLLGTQAAPSGSTGLSAIIDADITTQAADTSDALQPQYGDAIYARHGGSNAMSIRTNGSINAFGTGIYAQSTARASTTDIRTTGAIIAGADGIFVDHEGSGDLTIRTDAAITAGSDISGTGNADTAIEVNAEGGGDTLITVNANLTGNAGIDVDDDDTMGAITISIAAQVDATATTNPVAIAMTGGASHTLRLRTGANIMDAVTTDRTDATLEILGTHSFTPPAGFANFNLASAADTGNATTDRLTVADFASGSNLTLNVNFTDATADTLTIGGDVSGSAGAITINLVATAGTLDALTGAVTLVTFTTPANLDLADFTAGSLTGTDTASFTLSASAGNLQIMPAATGGGTPDPDPDPVVTMPDSCTEQSTMGTFVCAGAVADATTLAAAAGETLTVTATDDFTGITATMGDALTLTGAAGSTGIHVTLGGTISAGTYGDGIDATHAGSGPVSITANAITATNGSGIEVNTTATSATTMNITTNGAIMAGSAAGEAGIDVGHMGSGDLTITANAAVSGNRGITASTNATGSNITVTIGGTVDGSASSDPVAIEMSGGGEHRLVINSGGNIADGDRVTSNADTATLALNAAAGETDAEFDLGDLENFHNNAATPTKVFTTFEKTGAGTWTLTGDQTMDSSNMPMDRAFDSVSVMAGTLQLGDGTDPAIMALDANAILTLTDAATLNFMGTGNMISGSAMTGEGATLRLAGITGGNFDLADLSNFENFATFEKMDTGTWTLTGIQPSANAFDNALVMAGTLRLGDGTTAAEFRPGSSTLTIAATATLEVMSGSSIIGNVNNMANATMHLAGSTTITGTLTNTGTATATLGVNLTNPDMPTFEQLTINGSSSTGSVTIALNVTSDSDLELTPEQIAAVDLVSGASGLAFSAANGGNCTITGTRGNCTFDIDSNGNLTSLAVTLAAADILYENYVATLAEFSRMPGMRARFGNRIWAAEEGRGIWARTEAAVSEIEPNTPSETSAKYEIRDTRLHFGVDAPIRAVPGLILGGNVWLARAKSDISAQGEDTGRIETDGHALAATAHWQAPTGFYVDTQAQFATFTSDLSSAGETRVDGNDGSSVSLAAEVGYPVPVRAFTITPQTQLSWSDVEFDDFTDNDNARISTADGETVDARIGVSVDRRWSERSGTLGHVWGAVDLRAPLDGETSAKVDDSPPLISERKELTFGLAAGVSLLWSDNTTLSADLATTHGEDTETYRATLSAQIAF